MYRVCVYTQQERKIVVMCRIMSKERERRLEFLVVAVVDYVQWMVKQQENRESSTKNEWRSIANGKR